MNSTNWHQSPDINAYSRSLLLNYMATKIHNPVPFTTLLLSYPQLDPQEFQLAISASYETLRAVAFTH